MTRPHWTDALGKPMSNRIAWILWIILLSIFIVIVSLPSFDRTVTPNYTRAAQAWWNTQDPYSIQGEFFYLPQSAIAFSPFAYLPFHLSEALWRILTIGMLAIGVRSLSKVIHNRIGTDPFLVLSITTLALAWDGARNGQTNLPLTAVMIWFAISLLQKRYWQAVLWSCIGLLFKPYMIVPIALAIPLYPSFAWRFLIGAIGFAGFPFLFQKPGFVIDTYRSFQHMIMEQSHPPAEGTLFSDIFRSAYVFGLHLSDNVQLLIRAIAAIFTLGLTYFARKRYGWERGALMIYTSSVLYLTLFSPRIENNTYVLIGPLIGWIIVELWRARSHWNRLGWSMVTVFIIMITQRSISHIILPEQEALWLRPLSALALTITVIAMSTRCVGDERASSSPDYKM